MARAGSAWRLLQLGSGLGRGLGGLQTAEPLAASRPALALAAQGGRGYASGGSGGCAEHTGIVELRQYTLKPEGIKEFVRLTAEKVELRKQLLPFLGMFTCDTGGVLNRVVHFYHYDDYDHRDACRQAAAKSGEWQNDYLVNSRKCVQTQESSIYLPAAAVLAAGGAVPLQQFAAPGGEAAGQMPVYELRMYQLKPGYDGVPRLLEAFQKGLPHKVAADTQGQLAFFGYTDVGMLNNVVELWRYPSAQACIAARQAARKVQPWRDTIAAVTPGVEHFTSSFLQPLPFSSMQ